MPRKQQTFLVIIFSQSIFFICRACNIFHEEATAKRLVRLWVGAKMLLK